MVTLKKTVDNLCAQVDEQFGEGEGARYLAESISNGACGSSLKEKALFLTAYIHKSKTPGQLEIEALALERELADVKEETSRLQAETDKAKSRINELTVGNENLRAKLEGLEIETAPLRTSMRPDLRAASMLSASGLNPGIRRASAREFNNSGAPSNASQLLEQYNEITDPREAAAFYNRNSHLLK